MIVFAFPSPFEISVATAVGKEKEERVRIKTRMGFTNEYIPIASCPKKRVKIILEIREMHFALTPMAKIEIRWKDIFFLFIFHLIIENNNK